MPRSARSLLATLPLPVLAALCALLLSGCMTAEQRMVLKVDQWMGQQRYEAALDYLDGYLSRHNSSLSGWRYRVLIRLEQGDRATAASEYVALNDALGRHEPEVLREVVLGAGGRWLLSDYGALARCGSGDVVSSALFEELLEPKMLGRANLSKVVVSDDEIAAVLDALPGALAPGETWTLVHRFASHASPSIRARVVYAAGRHLATSSLSESTAGQALNAISAGASAGEGEIREAALLAGLLLPEGEGRSSFAAGLVSGLSLAGDEQRSVSAFLLGPGGSGSAEWGDDVLGSWAETAPGALRVLAVGELDRREPRNDRRRFLDKAAGSAAASERLAAGIYGDGAIAGAWSSLSLDDQRQWTPVFVRSAGSDGLQLAELALGATDGVLVQGTAAALALGPGFGAGTLDTALGLALASSDPATRAQAAGTAVLCGATTLTPGIEAAFRRDDDRVMMAALRRLVQRGSSDWPTLPALGLASSIPTVREQAVDALVADCRPESREQLFALLDDSDPHVAVRAAAGLYLLVGSVD